MWVVSPSLSLATHCHLVKNRPLYVPFPPRALSFCKKPSALRALRDVKKARRRADGSLQDDNVWEGKGRRADGFLQNDNAGEGKEMSLSDMFLFL